ncbi:MAG: hypothetical protein RJA63_1043 [Pseudomonadota bacterium]|jgi:hypothetical protein
MKAQIRPLLLSLALVLPISTAWAFDEAGFNTAFAHLQKAREGDSKSVDVAVDAFSKLSAQEPGNPLLRAYQGSVEALQGREALLPWNKMKYTENGLATLDKALQQLAPEHEQQLARGVPILLETRLVAASTFLSLPSMFNRGPVGHQQLQALIANPVLLKAPDGFRHAVVELAVKTAQAEKLPAERINQLQLLTSANAAQRESAQAQLKDLWK